MQDLLKFMCELHLVTMEFFEQEQQWYLKLSHSRSDILLALPLWVSKTYPGAQLQEISDPDKSGLRCITYCLGSVFDLIRDSAQPTSDLQVQDSGRSGIGTTNPGAALKIIP